MSEQRITNVTDVAGLMLGLQDANPDVNFYTLGGMIFSDSDDLKKLKLPKGCSYLGDPEDHLIEGWLSLQVNGCRTDVCGRPAV